MPLLDERGRLFGRINLIDAIVALVALGLIPLAYGAFLLFRQQPPQVTSIEPAQIYEDQAAVIRVNGDALRPFMGAKLNGSDGQVSGFLVESPTRAELRVGKLTRGTYELTLFDRGTEVVRVPRALTVIPWTTSSNEPPPEVTEIPPVELQAIGRFIGLNRTAAAAVRVRTMFDRQPGPGPRGETSAEVTALQPAEPATRRVTTGSNRFVAVPAEGEYHLPATLRVRCVVMGSDCKFGETSVAEGAVLTLVPRRNGEGPADPVRFVVEDVRSPGSDTIVPSVQRAVATLRVRFVAPPALADQLRAGDADTLGEGVFDEGSRAVLMSIGSERQPVEVMSRLLGNLELPQEMVAFTATVRVPVVFMNPGPSTSAGWSYKGRHVRIGVPFAFETASGYLTGSILDMQISGDAPVKP